MKPYLTLQYPYEHIEIAICDEGVIKETVTEHKHYAVQLTIPKIEELINKHDIHLKDLSFIAVNTGPGPYNTLRALITTANGIHFAQKTPLVSLNALDLLLMETQHHSVVAVLNAFAQHVFYAFDTPYTKEQGYCSLEQLAHKIHNHPIPVLLVGNGALLYQQYLLKNVTHNIIFHEKTPHFNSIDICAKHAYERYTHKKIEPTYLSLKYF